MTARVTAEALFERHFWPLYPPDVRDGGLATARATDANPAGNPSVVAHLDDAARVFAARAPALFDVGGTVGAPAPALALDFTDASVHRLSAAITRERRDAWAAAGAVGTPDNELFNVVVHGAAYIGACVVAAHDARWAVRRPLWESLVTLKSRAGEGALPLFHWWLKALSDDTLAPVDPKAPAPLTLADRYRTFVEIPSARPEELPVLAPPDRPLPRLARVRYDVFYKYLKAHLPELRDVGRDFPSPERFDELGLAWIDFVLLGGGRLLLMYGPGRAGVHLFWMSTGGFDKSAFFPADPKTSPAITVRGDTLALDVTVGGRPQTHEMLWWGP